MANHLAVETIGSISLEDGEGKRNAQIRLKALGHWRAATWAAQSSSNP
jgi:hypothetical protein